MRLSFFLAVALIFLGDPGFAFDMKEIAHFGNKVLYAFLVVDDVSASEAKSVCETEGLTLAALETPVENKVVGRFLRERLLRRERIVNGWLGGSDAKTEGIWYWIDPYDNIGKYRNWAKGEPIQDDEYNCMYMNPQNNTDNAQWKSYYCNERWGLPICQKLLPPF